jgi:hypothetical protein
MFWLPWKNIRRVILRLEGGSPTLREALHTYLRERGALLLILDNMEHVLAAAPDVAELLAAVAAAMGEFERAACPWGAAEVSLETGEPAMMIHMPDRSVKVAALADTQSQLGQAALTHAWARGRELTFEQAVEYAISWEQRKDS